MDLYAAFVWMLIGVSGLTIVFAVLAILSLIFDGFLDWLAGWLKRAPK